MRYFLSLFGLSICTVLFGLPTLHVHAMGVSPSIVDGITVEPGARIQFEFRVLNDAGRDTQVAFRTQNFRADSGEEGGQEFIEEQLPAASDLASWIQVATEENTVPAGGEISAYAIVTVPENADPGGHYAVIWTSEESAQGNGNVSISSNVGLLVLINVTGDVDEDAEIVDFTADKTRASALPIQFTTRVANKGSVYFKPKGEIRITNMFGKQVAAIDINPNQSNVLPGSIRRLNGVTWTRNATAFSNGFINKLQQEWASKAIGKYTAGIYLFYPDGSIQSAPSVDIWIIPWRTMLTVFIAVILLVLLIKGYNALIISHAKKRL